MEERLLGLGLGLEVEVAGQEEGLTAQLGLGVDLLIGYVAHEERETPRIPESGSQAI